MAPKLNIIINEDIAVQYLDWAKQEWVKKVGKWSKHLGDCLIDFYNDGNDSGYITFIPDNSGLVCRPRTGLFESLPYYDLENIYYTTGVAGYGWKNLQVALLNNKYAIQPVQSWNADSLLVNQTIEFSQLEYGNCYWFSEDGETILSWSGPTAKTHNIARNIGIPQLSTAIKFDSYGSVLENTEYNTKVYKNGEVYATVNGLILAACETNALYIVCLQQIGTLYFTKLLKADVPNADKTVWVELINVILQSYGVIWEFSQDGKVAYCINGDKISVENRQYIPITKPKGTYTEKSGSSGYWTAIDFNRAFNGTALTTATSSANLTFTHSNSTLPYIGYDTQSDRDVPIYYVPMPGPLQIIRTSAGIYTATGGVPPYTFSVDCGTINKDGVADFTGCCGTVTVTVTDSCNTESSIEERMSRGSWCFVSREGVYNYIPPSGCLDLYDCPDCVTIYNSDGINGGTKRVIGGFTMQGTVTHYYNPGGVYCTNGTICSSGTGGIQLAACSKTTISSSLCPEYSTLTIVKQGGCYAGWIDTYEWRCSCL